MDKYLRENKKAGGPVHTLKGGANAGMTHRIRGRIVPQKIICPQCGAVIPPGEARCPYCLSAYAPGAEREYMEHLEEVRSDLDQVGDVGRVASHREIGSVGRRIATVVGVILALAAVLFGIFLYMERCEVQKDRREYLWKKDHLPEMEQLFEAGEYDQLLDKIQAARDDGIGLYDWKHSDFMSIYETTRYMDSALEARRNGYFSEFDAENLLYDELRCRGIEWLREMPDADREKIRPFLEPYRNDLTEIFHAAQSDIDSFDKALKERDGYPDYESCKKYIAAHPEILLEKKP